MPKTSEKLNLIQHTTAQAEFAAELNSAPVTAYHEATVPIYENTSILEPAWSYLQTENGHMHVLSVPHTQFFAQDFVLLDA